MARYQTLQRKRMRVVYLRRRIVAGVVLVTIAAAACLGVRAMASRGDGAASLPTVTPQGPAVLFTAIDTSGANIGTENLAGAFARTDQVYVVQPGDTLWSIASSLTQGSIRSYVSDLIELNGSASVQVGQRLTLPSD